MTSQLLISQNNLRGEIGMKIINATFFIKEDKREDFLKDVLPLVEATRLEKGCLYYHLYESVENKNEFVMVENWEDQEAIDGHNQSPLLHQLFANLKDYVEKPTVLTVSEKE